MEIIDNFLNEDQFELISSTLQSDNFPWYLSPVSRPQDLLCDSRYNFQFCHQFYYEGGYGEKSSMFELMTPILEKLNPYQIIRIKANCVPVTETVMEHGFHTDVPKERQSIIKTGIYYVNSNDGHTRFENGSIIESVRNRLVLFDSSLRHTGSSCTNSSTRIVVNFNLIL